MNFDNMCDEEKQDALREINLMSKVKHPFILEYISFFFYDFEQKTKGTKRYLVLELELCKGALTN